MNNLTTWFLNSENQQVSENITDVPPITFNSNGEPLTNWKIVGSQAGVGDATENLFNIDTAIQGYKYNDGNLVKDDNCLASPLIPCEYSDVFSVSHDSIGTNQDIWCGMFDENKNFISAFSSYTSLIPAPPRTKYDSLQISEQQCKYFAFYLKKCQNIMLTKTSTAQDYEPYGYKIPVECGGTITNIYIDEPLYEDDSIGYKDVKITIPTVDGENELDIDTTNAPTSVSIQTNGVSQGFRDYFKAQMIINND